MSQNKAATDTAPDEQQVAGFLQATPDFFLRHAQLLPHMEVPHDNGSAVSLVERQMTLLREENAALRQQLDEQHEQGIRNDRSQKRLHEIVKSILNATDINIALQDLQDSLASLFQLEYSQVRLFADSKHPLENVERRYVHHSLSARKSLDDFTPSNTPVCSALNINQLRRIFADDADQVASNVFIPLRKDLLYGFIALGSHEEGRYTADMKTDYLQRVSELVAISLARFIE